MEAFLVMVFVGILIGGFFGLIGLLFRGAKHVVTMPQRAAETREEIRIATEKLAVPTAALVQLEGKAVVFRRSADGVEPVEVQPGSIIGERTEIIAGISAGDSIAVTGAFTLKSRQLKSQMGEGHGH